MGTNCSCAGREVKENISKEEQILHETEVAIGLSEINAIRYDKDIARYAINGRLDDRLLKVAYESMGLESGFFSEDESFKYRFYGSLANKLEGYDMKTLSCLGILLGKGETDKKAELLFKNYDRDCSNELDVNEAVIMFNDMMAITAAIIEIAKFMNPRKQNMLTNYSRKIKENRKSAWSTLYFLLYQDGLVGKLSMKEFVGKFEDRTLKNLCTAAGFRKVLLEVNSNANDDETI